jgi:metallo-beta-lactamase family protein
MEVTFYGAVREVTGSMHLLAAGEDRILLDCGLFQGRRREAAERNRVFPFDPRLITNMILSHAHLDHSGRIPLLTRKDFSGRIICTLATVDACAYLLPDSAHIQESDAAYLNYKTVRAALAEMRKSKKAKRISHGAMQEIKRSLKQEHRLDTEAIDAMIERHHLRGVQPLYTIEDAHRALSYLDGYPYRHPVPAGGNVTCTLYDAGHILGSAITMLRVKENGRVLSVGFTGDIGRFRRPILRDPTLRFEEADRRLDLLIMESTYGNRLHEPIEDLKPRLKQVLRDTYERGGTLLIPAFAFGRTQELIYLLHEIYREEGVPRMPIYVDSPLASNLTRVFGEHPEDYDRQAHEEFLEKGKNPFSFQGIRFVQSVEESMALNRDQSPHIVIAASGMCEAGRILHHLRHKIHNARNTILIVGFMAEHTLGRRILDQGLAYEASGRKGEPPLLKFLNKLYPLRAQVVSVGGLSAHADREELLGFLRESNLSVEKIALVHGEEEQAIAFAEALRQKGYDAFVPRAGETLRVG